MSRTPEQSRLSLILTAAAASLTVAAAAHAQFEFDIEPVRQDGMWNSRSSIAVDEAGVIHMAHIRQFDTDSSTSEVWYGTNAGGAWAFTQITDNSVREEFPDLTLDADGNVHIAVHTGVTNGNKIRYTNNISGTFFDPIDITGAGFIIVDHAVDAAGNAHFAFTSQTSTLSDDLYYCTRSAAGVVSAPMPLTASSAWDTDPNIAVDAQGHVHIVWDKGNTLGYVNNVGGSFVEVPTGVATVAEDPMIAFGPGGVVSILYSQSLINGIVKIIDNAGGSFSAPADAIPPGQYRAFGWDNLVVDAQGRRYFCFSSNVLLEGVFFVGETDAGFAEPVFLAASALTNFGGSVGVNGSGKIAVSFEQTGTAGGNVLSDVYVATLRSGDFDPDLDNNGVVDVFDLLAYLDLWFTSDPAADLDGTPGVDVFDLLLYLDAWFEG